MLTVSEAIARRISTRTFTDQAVPAGLLEELCADSPTLTVLDPDALGSGRVGTYGIIKGRPRYVAVAADDQLQAGIEGERLVVELTRRGLATCWISGTFNRSLTRRTAGHDIAAVIAVGYAAPRAGLIERVMRSAVHARSRRPLSELIIAGAMPEHLTEAVEAIRLAPSACNRQPWRIAFNPSGSVDIFGDPKDSMLLLDCGIGLCHFLLMRPDYRLEPNTGTYTCLTPIISLTPNELTT